MLNLFPMRTGMAYSNKKLIDLSKNQGPSEMSHLKYQLLQER